MLKKIIITTVLLTNLFSSIYYIDNNKKLNNVLKTVIDNNNSENTFIVKSFDKNITINNNKNYQNIKLNIIDTDGHLLKQTNLYFYMKTKQWSPAETLKGFANNLKDSNPTTLVIKKPTNNHPFLHEKIQLPIKNKKIFKISNIVKQIIQSNKKFIKINKNKDNLISKDIEEMKNSNKMKIINPFKQKSIDLYKYNNKNYKKNELLSLIKNNKIKIIDKNIINLSLTLRSINDLNYKLLKNFYFKIRNKISNKAKIYILNTLLLIKNNTDIEKQLGKILLKNQRNLNKKEVKISYKLLNIF